MHKNAKFMATYHDISEIFAASKFSCAFALLMAAPRVVRPPLQAPPSILQIPNRIDEPTKLNESDLWRQMILDTSQHERRFWCSLAAISSMIYNSFH